jgi:hypothetical protein
MPRIETLRCSDVSSPSTPSTQVPGQASLHSGNDDVYNMPLNTKKNRKVYTRGRLHNTNVHTSTTYTDNWETGALNHGVRLGENLNDEQTTGDGVDNYSQHESDDRGKYTLYTMHWCKNTG